MYFYQWADDSQRAKTLERQIVESLQRALAGSQRESSAAPIDWMAGAPIVSPYRRELAAAIREQVDKGGDVYLGPTDALIASDALDGFREDG